MIPHLRSASLVVAALLTASVAVGAKSPPAPALPHPSGSLAVGTTVVHLVDSSRTAGPPGATFARPISVQLWYPAASDSAAATAPYLVEPGLTEAVVPSGYYGVDSTTLRAWGSLATAARMDAPLAPGMYRLVTLSHGLGMLRANYTALA